MKCKKMISLLLVAVMALGMLSGCGADNTPGNIPDTTPENPTAATLLSAEEDARLKEELQKNIDAILNT